MSVEAPKTVDETPVVEPVKAVTEQQPEPATTEPAAAATEATPATETTPAAPVEETAAAPVDTEELKKDETVVEAVPTSEGVLGYKEPHFFKKFIFTKHYFWVSEEPSTAESLNAFLRSEKSDSKHSSASWARETGKGLLFYAKRAEDKAVPAGLINLSDASVVTKESPQVFSFKAGGQHHRFEAATSKERDSWIVAVEKAIEEAKAIKDEITGRESYKKNLDDYAKPTIVPAAIATKTSRSKSKEPKKSIDAATATAAADKPVADNASSSSDSSNEATKSAKKDKERSQSRKRGSIFGSLLGKKEEHDVKKEEKAEVKKEVKEDKEAEAEIKKEEAKSTDAPTTTVDAAESSAAAAAVAVAPAAAVAAVENKEEKDEQPTAATGTEKKGKRSSVFGSLFKKSVTSPTTEKTEKEATTSDIPPVSETAPKLDEPIENKPIDTAAVTAPADDIDIPSTVVPTEETPKDTTTPATTETATPAKTEKKSGIFGFIKKPESKVEAKKEQKEEAKEEAAAETIAKDPVTAAAPTETSTETPATTDSPVDTATPAKEERPARDGTRRTSLFFNKNKKDATSDGEGAPETKREKSPLPGKFIGNLVRRASKAVKHDTTKEKPATETAVPEPVKESTTDAAPAAPATETPETKIIGDVVPEAIVATPNDSAAPAVAPEVKATA